MTIIQGHFGDRAKKVEKGDDTVKKPAPCYQFHVSLAFSDPLIWRRIQVPGEMNLQQFHKVLQICLGWSGEHNHKFYVGKIFYQASPQGIEEEYDEAKFALQTLEEAMRWCFTYIYDAGDGWEHDIVLEEARPPQTDKKHPVLLDGEWAAPPEAVGSVHVYGEIFQALSDRRENKSQQLLHYHGIKEFDPVFFDLKGINQVLKSSDWRL